MGNRPDPFLQLGFAPLPAFTAKPVQHNAVATFAIAAEHVDILDRHIELVAAGIFQMHAIMRAGADRYRDDAFIQADAVLQMNNQIALAERRQFLDKGIAALAALRFADQPVAENILLGEQGQVFCPEARGQGQNGQRHPRFGRQAGLPVVTEHGCFYIMVLEQIKNACPRPLAVARDNRRAAGLRQAVEMGTQCPIDILVARPFGREVAGR